MQEITVDEYKTKMNQVERMGREIEDLTALNCSLKKKVSELETKIIQYESLPKDYSILKSEYLFALYMLQDCMKGKIDEEQITKVLQERII